MLNTSGDKFGGGGGAVKVSGLTKTYGEGDDAVEAVDDVSFEVASGSVVGLLGPNGAGKTTTVKSILGLVTPTSGEITVDGVSVTDSSTDVYRHVSGMLEGARNVYWRLTVRENLHFFTRLTGATPERYAEEFDRLLSDLDLAGKADVTVNELSRGMKQKTSLACTLVRQTPVVLLDEPTLGLDVESRNHLCRELDRLAESESITILLSSHNMSVIEEVCDRAIIMDGGSVVVDEQVDNLLDRFQEQAFRVTVEPSMDDDVRRAIDSEYRMSDYEEVDGGCVFEVTLAPTALSDLLARVESAGHEVTSFNSVEPNLEDVFLGFTNDDHDATSARTEVRNS